MENYNLISKFDIERKQQKLCFNVILAIKVTIQNFSSNIYGNVIKNQLAIKWNSKDSN